MVYDCSSKLCCSVPQKFSLFTCVHGAWQPIPRLTSFHFLFHMCWNEGSVENVHCDTKTWRMWESQSSRSKHFSPPLFSSTEVKVFCILMRISDAQRSHPESFTIRHEDICVQLCSLLFCLLLSRSLPLHIVNSSFVHYDKQKKHSLITTIPVPLLLETLEINVSVEWQKIISKFVPWPSETQKRQNAAIRQYGGKLQKGGKVHMFVSG